MVWEQRSFSFVAATAAATVRFWNDRNAYACFAFIDGASVQASVPEPHAAALLLAGLLAGAGALRRTRFAAWPIRAGSPAGAL